MNASRTTFTVILCLSLPTYSMDQKTASPYNSLASLSKDQIMDIRNLYNDTYEKFNNMTSNHNSHAIPLLDIINRTVHLKNQNINELHIGEFAFKQTTPLKNHILNLTTPPYNGPHYISVFFARLSQYNEQIKKQNSTTPTYEEFGRYNNNLKITSTNASAQSFHLKLNEISINSQLIAIPETVAMDDFFQLLGDTYILRSKTPTDIKAIAEQFYLPGEAKK